MAVGCDIIDAKISTAALQAEAVAAAKKADVVVLAIGIAQCGCMGITDTYMGGKTTNSHGCATSVVPPYKPWGNCWNHAEVEAGEYVGAEAHDKILIDLPPVQRAFASAIFAVGKPVVLLILNGGSVDIGPELKQAEAAIDAFCERTSVMSRCIAALTFAGRHDRPRPRGRRHHREHPVWTRSGRQSLRPHAVHHLSGELRV